MWPRSGSRTNSSTQSSAPPGRCALLIATRLAKGRARLAGPGVCSATARSTARSGRSSAATMTRRRWTIFPSTGARRRQPPPVRSGFTGTPGRIRTSDPQIRSLMDQRTAAESITLRTWLSLIASARTPDRKARAKSTECHRVCDRWWTDQLSRSAGQARRASSGVHSRARRYIGQPLDTPRHLDPNILISLALPRGLEPLFSP
jgi:hypothetical protein